MRVQEHRESGVDLSDDPFEEGGAGAFPWRRPLAARKAAGWGMMGRLAAPSVSRFCHLGICT